MPPLNSHLRATVTPPIPLSKGWAGRYDGRAGPLIDLCQAAPGDPPAPEFLSRLGEAAQTADSARYGAALGDPGLRADYARHLNGVYGGDCTADEVAISTGCNQAFLVSALALAAPGDAVLLPTPYYFNHQMTLQMLGIEARFLPCAADEGFLPDVAQADSLIDDKVRAIVLVTPNNPTGAAFDPTLIGAFFELCQARGIWLILDETYRDFLPAGQDRPHALMVRPDWRECVVQLYSFSKSLGIPGHRLGAIAASKDFMDEILKVMDSLQVCPPRPVQSAVAWALEGLNGWRQEQREKIARRAKVFADVMTQLPQWEICAQGAYFAYVRHPFENRPGQALCEELVDRCGVLALPGSFFGPGQEQFLRLAFANVDESQLAQVPERLALL